MVVRWNQQDLWNVSAMIIAPGLFLSLGFDSHNANILINLDLDGDGELDGEKYWSFDALYSALMGDVFVKNGMEAEEPAE